MRSESCEQLKAPRVATHFPSLREEIDFNTNTHVFKRHASLAVMPIGGESLQVPNFSVDIQGGSEHKTRAITILESLTSRDWHDWRGLEELLSDSVEQIARYLTWHGRVVHEIIRDVETGEARRLHGFTSRRLFHVFWEVHPDNSQGRPWRMGKMLHYDTGGRYLGYRNAEKIGWLPRLPCNAQEAGSLSGSRPTFFTGQSEQARVACIFQLPTLCQGDRNFRGKDYDTVGLESRG